MPPTMVEETAAGTKSPPPASVSSAEKGAEVDADPQPPNPPPRSQATTALLESALAQDDSSDKYTSVQNANRKHPPAKIRTVASCTTLLSIVVMQARQSLVME